jgi:hypothetical protein
MDTIQFTDKIKNSEQVIFLKFGDGEVNGIYNESGANCDNDPYTKELGQGLVNSLILYSHHPNAYIGKWHGEQGFQRLQHVINVLQIPQPKFVDYHLVYNDEKVFFNKNLFNFVKTVQDSDRKKIIVSNSNNIRLKKVFNTENFFEVAPRNWFVNFDSILSQLKEQITDNCILLTAAGMGSKVLIAELLKTNPTISAIDIGSSFDYLCQKKNTRDRTHSYEDIYNYYKELLPSDWEDSNSKKAAICLRGVHFIEKLDNWYVNYKDALESFNTCLLEPLRNAGYTQIDVFMSTYETNVLDELKRDYNVVKLMLPEFDINADRQDVTFEHFIRLFEGVISYEKENNFKYDFIVSTRFDVKFNWPIDNPNPLYKKVDYNLFNITYIHPYGHCDDCLWLFPRKHLEDVLKGCYYLYTNNGWPFRIHEHITKPINYLCDVSTYGSGLENYSLTRKSRSNPKERSRPN